MKDNKLIADFLSVGKHYEAQSSNQFNQYHTDWNELIKAIHSCFAVAEDGDMIHIMHHLQVADMKSTYNAVIEFINLYNQKSGGMLYLYYGGERPMREVKVKSKAEADRLGRSAEHYEYEPFKD